MKRCLFILTAVACWASPSESAEVLVSLTDDENVLNGAGAEDAAVVIRTGEAEYRTSVPLGEWYDIAPVAVNKNGVQTLLNRRTLRMDEKTYRGQLNVQLSRLKEECPTKEIYLVTPVVDAAADARNDAGALLGDYVQALREAGTVWSVTIIDLAGAASVSEPKGEAFFLLGPEGTNRPPASVCCSVVGCLLDSRGRQSVESPGVRFRTDAGQGLSMMMR